MVSALELSVPSAFAPAKPAAVVSLVRPVELSVMVSVVGLVITTDVKSVAANTTFAVVALSPSMSQANRSLAKFNCETTSVPTATPKVSKFVPVSVITPVALYAALVMVVVGASVSITMSEVDEIFAKLGTVVPVIVFP